MSRCGSCPIYDRKRYGIRCDGDHGVEECADKLQELYYAMRADGPIEKALEDWGAEITGINTLLGCCELLAVTDVSARFCICSGILAFGGLCVTMQTVSVTAGLSLKPYFLGKLLQTLFSLALAALIAYGIWLPFGVLSVGALVIKLQKRGSFSRVFGV